MLDASTGALVNNILAVPNCKDSLGLFADSAIMGDVVFVNGVNCKLPPNPANPAPAGVVIALNNDASGKVWEFPSTTPQISSVLSGVAVANGMNGVVYFHDSGPSSYLYALNAKTGELLAQVSTEPFRTSGISGPSVSNGQIYVGVGISFATNGQATSTPGIVAFGL